jgi:hypothetical protein
LIPPALIAKKHFIVEKLYFYFIAY